MNPKTTAIDAYLARAAAIRIKWARLQQLADDHFGHAPEAIHWSHVGDIKIRKRGASNCSTTTALWAAVAKSPSARVCTTRRSTNCFA